MRVLENYIGGKWVSSAGEELHEVTDPATGEVLAEVPFSVQSDLDAAVEAAREALPVWRDVSTIARGRLMFELRQKLVARRGDLARAVTVEMGKTLPDADAEVGRMIEMVEAAAAVPTTMQGRVLEDVARGVDAETIRQPHTKVVSIDHSDRTPFRNHGQTREFGIVSESLIHVTTTSVR